MKLLSLIAIGILLLYLFLGFIIWTIKNPRYIEEAKYKIGKAILDFYKEEMK